MKDDQIRLQQTASKFRQLLEKYARSDHDVEDFLRRITPWFERIERGEITPPCTEYQLYHYFANPDLSPLAERYMSHEQ